MALSLRGVGLASPGKGGTAASAMAFMDALDILLESACDSDVAAAPTARGSITTPVNRSHSRQILRSMTRACRESARLRASTPRGGIRPTGRRGEAIESHMMTTADELAMIRHTNRAARATGSQKENGET